MIGNKLSVYMVYRDYPPEWLSESLMSLYEQSIVDDIEIIFLSYGDKELDTMLCLLDDFFEKDNFRFYHHKCDSFVDAIKFATSKCNGDYIMRLDADDILLGYTSLEYMLNKTIETNADLLMNTYMINDQIINPRTDNLMCQAIIKADKLRAVEYVQGQTFRDGTTILNTFNKNKYMVVYGDDICTFFHRIHNKSLTSNKDKVKEMDKKLCS